MQLLARGSHHVLGRHFTYFRHHPAIAPGQGDGGILKICLLGAECTGKTTLATALAQAPTPCWCLNTCAHLCSSIGRVPTADE